MGKKLTQCCNKCYPGVIRRLGGIRITVFRCIVFFVIFSRLLRLSMSCICLFRAVIFVRSILMSLSSRHFQLCPRRGIPRIPQVSLASRVVTPNKFLIRRSVPPALLVATNNFWSLKLDPMCVGSQRQVPGMDS